MASRNRTNTRSGPKIAELVRAMEFIAPVRFAADWDNVGLLAGNPDWPLTRILLAIDLTGAVLDEAVAARCDAILAYHPPIFRPIKRLAAGRDTAEALAATALSHRMAIYSPHTAWDCAEGGTNDTLAALCGLKVTRPFAFAPAVAPQFKLAVFVPHGDADRLAAALCRAGAGRIGDYQQCSFRSPGQGTFFGADSTNPAIGKKGRLERVEELRLELVLPRKKLADVIAALRAAHPYEEPAFDIYPIEPAPDRRAGQGRIGEFSKPVRLGRLARRLAARISARNVSIIGKPAARIRSAMICAGSAGTLPFEIPGRPAGPGDVVITGEIRHHDALHYHRAGACAIALGHWASERPSLTNLARRLRSLLPASVKIAPSRTDRDPFNAP